jgi:hypothetical protein
MANACGAKTSSGEPCKRAPSKGKTRCKLHGGGSTGPKLVNHLIDPSTNVGNQYSKTHGIYGKHLTQEERDDSARIELGNLDALIRIAHVQHARAWEARQNADSGSEIDYDAKIDKCMARIGSLEIQRKALMEKADNGVLHLNITGGMQEQD